MSWQRTGTKILDRYVLGARIGLGGTSEVYHAIDVVEHRPAAAKLLSPAFANNIRAVDLARREAWVISQMRHPTIPALYDHGDILLSEGVVVPCTIMELLTGVMLTDRLARGPLPWKEAATVAATVADALAVAHRRGIVHRDLTSGNVMITDHGIKIIDFGLADVLHREPPGTGRLVFRAHDRAVVPASCRPRLPADRGGSDDPLGRGEPADDVFSLGVLLYQMLTGRSPYPDGDADDLPAAARQRRAVPTPVFSIPGLPRPVADCCRDCMARLAVDRPDSVTVALSLWAVLV